MITKQLEELLQDDERALAAAKKRLSRCAEGRIHIKRRRHSVAFYRELPRDPKEKRKEIHLSKQDSRLISSLCNKRYCQQLIPVLEDEIKTLKSFLQKYDPQRKLHAFLDLPAEIAAHVDPIIQTNRQIFQKWKKEKFDSNPYPMDHNAYKTKEGEVVRSRLELISADMMHDLGIPYRYECALYFPDGSVSYPDFTILHPETLELYWMELFGMMDDPDYAAAAFQKISKYAQAGILPRLIPIFDHKDVPFSTEMLNEVLRSAFLT